MEIDDSVYRRHAINSKPGYVRQARIDFARHIEAVTIERAANTMKRVEGPPLELKIVPLYAVEEKP